MTKSLLRSSALRPQSVAAALVLATACSVVFSETIHGSGTSTEESRTLPAFHAIVVEGALDVDVVAGRAPRAVVAAHDNQLAYVETEVSEGVLHVRVRTGYDLEPPATVDLECERLDAFTLAGSGKVDIQGVSGAALELRITGAADVRARGAVHEVDVEIAGSGDVDLFDLSSDRASVRVAGSGDVRVHARETLDVNVSGSGDVRYRGRPQVSRRIAGTGVVEPAD